MKYSRVLIAVCIGLSALLALTPSVSAILQVRYFTEQYLISGTITTGNLASLHTIDSDVMTLEETGGSTGYGTMFMHPNRDNVTQDWGTTCGGYYSCVDDYPSYAYNSSYVWAVNPADSNLTMGIDPFLLDETVYTIYGIETEFIARKNSSGISLFTVDLIDPATGRVCYGGTSPTLTQNFWIFRSASTSGCTAGTQWNKTVYNRIEVRLRTSNNVVVTVTDIHIRLSYFIGIANLDSQFNLTVAARQVPYSVNWTCNRTSEDTYQLLVWSQYPYLGWAVMKNPICSVGAQTNDSLLLPSSSLWLSGGVFRIRIKGSGYNAANPGQVVFDRLILTADYTPPPPPPVIMDPQGIAVWFLLIFFCGGLILVAVAFKRWREDHL